MSSNIDQAYAFSYSNAMDAVSVLNLNINTKIGITGNMDIADKLFDKCVGADKKFFQCFNNYGQVYARAAYRGYVAGMDVQAWLARAIENLTIAQNKNAGLDAEQGAALSRLVEASLLVDRKQDAGPALAAAREALACCFGMVAEDATCRAYAAQVEWGAADALASQGKPIEATLQAALEKARVAAASREKLPESRWVLAESHLRLAQTVGSNRTVGVSATARAADSRRREAHIRDGLAAAEQIFAINPSHAQGRATQGALYLLRAQTSSDPATRVQAAGSAVQSLERALQRDPLLSHRYSPLVAQARALVAKP